MARGLIYAFVARRPSTVLCDHTAFAGNFSVVALQVRCGQERQSSPPKKKDVAWRVGIFARRARQAGHQASDLRGPAQLVPVERSRRAGCGAQSCGRRRCARARALQKEEKPLLRRLFARPLVSPRTRKVLQRTAAEEGALLCPHPPRRSRRWWRHGAGPLVADICDATGWHFRRCASCVSCGAPPRPVPPPLAHRGVARTSPGASLGLSTASFGRRCLDASRGPRGQRSASSFALAFGLSRAAARAQPHRMSTRLAYRIESSVEMHAKNSATARRAQAARTGDAVKRAGA